MQLTKHCSVIIQAEQSGNCKQIGQNCDKQIRLWNSLVFCSQMVWHRTGFFKKYYFCLDNVLFYVVFQPFSFFLISFLCFPLFYPSPSCSFACENIGYHANLKTALHKFAELANLYSRYMMIVGSAVIYGSEIMKFWASHRFMQVVFIICIMSQTILTQTVTKHTNFMGFFRR